jgi:hypothetical protein
MENRKSSKAMTEQEQAAGNDPDLVRRKDLGKKKKLWTIEVICAVGAEIKRHALANQTAQEITNFRKNIFSTGLMLPDDPGHWVIVPPWKILEVHLERQEYFIDEAWKA